MASAITFGNDNSGFQAGAVHGPVHNTFHNSYATGRSGADLRFVGSERALTAAPLQHDQRHHHSH